tara:strand:- start:319 stop:969 length:651 start_codon:yes stop_codon:yes gene_type:complete
MNVLELFAGSRSIGKIAEDRGHNVFSIDIKEFDDINLVKDVEDVTPYDIPFKPDMIWASPPCTTFSIMGVAAHRKNGLAVSDFAHKSDRLVRNTLKLIDYYNCIYYIENPRATLRKQIFMRGIPRTTIWYCTYGDTSAKPTDIWSNNIRNIFNPTGWEPRPICHNNNRNCHHESAPRGSKTGTQGKKGNYERSILPRELCKEIILATEKSLQDAKE